MKRWRATQSTTPSSTGRIARGAFDVIVMSYLLSFLPTPALRLRACRTAAESLRPGGALLIVEARRGGHRVQGWPAQWTAALTAQLPLVRIRLDFMKKSVALLFVRCADDDVVVSDVNAPPPPPPMAFDYERVAAVNAAAADGGMKADEAATAAAAETTE